jgi:hypothetical protein
MAFKIGHPRYTTKGDFRKGHIPWNANTAIRIDVECLQCDKDFKIRKQQYDRGRGKYCSKECFIKSLKKRNPWNKSIKIIKICLQCNKNFEVRACEEYRKFCSKKCADNFRKGKKGTPFTKEHKRKIGEANKLAPHLKGKKHPNWKGGITPLICILRTLDEYKEWRMECLKRDYFRCQECFSKEKLEVHHLKLFRILVTDFLQEYSQFSIIEDKETLLRLAINYKPFWDLDNGIVYCIEYHRIAESKMKREEINNG